MTEVITMASSKDDLLQRLENDQEAHINFLRSFIQPPSPNPPGDTVAAANIVRAYLESHQIEAEAIEPLPKAVNLVSTFEGQAKPTTDRIQRHLVLNGHIDQFPVEDANEWERDPYSGDIVDGRVHGRGGVDMKAGTAALVIAYAYLHSFRSSLSAKCVLEAVSDEETGGKFGTRYLLEQDERKELWKGDCVLNTEPGGLESIRFGEKGTLRMTFQVKTAGGHGAYVFQNEGAIRIAARLIDKLVRLEQLAGEGMDPELKSYLGGEDVRKVTESIMGPGAGDAMLKPTVNIGTIQGGIKVNMIPATCVFEADIRLPIGLTTNKVLAEIDTILNDFPGASYEVQQAASNRPAFSSHTHEMVRHIQSNAKAIGKEETPPLPICSLGATDCKHFRYHGVPAFTIGPRPDGMAARDESVSIAEFLETVKIVTLAAWDYLGGPQ